MHHTKSLNKENNSMMKSNKEGHPLLRDYNNNVEKSHGFSSSQMVSLRIICDTFIPSILLIDPSEDKDVQAFYSLAGHENGVPHKVAEMIEKRTKKTIVMVIKLMLSMLSTRLGTCLLCGYSSLKSGFPYFQTFRDIPLSQREQILRSWSRGKPFLILKSLFKLLKICCLFAFYTLVDEHGQNPSWKAIGYTPPDNTSKDTEEKRPLDKGIINITCQEDLQTGLGNSAEKKGEKQWKLKCDAVIVGSGCGGAVAAGVLAKQGYKVIVLEKGNYFSRSDLTLLEGPSLQHMYESGGILSTNDGKVLIMAGSTVGGGTAVNWSACIDTPEQVLNEWSSQGLSFFDTEEYKAAMDSVRKRLNVQNSCEKHSFQNAVLLQGCEKLGLKTEPVSRNSSKSHYCGACCFGCKTGDKQSTEETWLKDAVDNGARILTNCKAKRVRMSKGRATGVDAEFSFGDLRIQSKVTVVACGALMTPPLLLRSGLKNPNIGRGLHLHPVVMAWGYFPENRDPPGNVYEGGIITSICKAGKGTIMETPALSPGSFSALMPWVSGLDMKNTMTKYSRTAHVFSLARDRGCGKLSSYEKDIEYHLHDEDKEVLREGLRRALRVLIAAGASEVGTHGVSGRRLRVDGSSEDDVERFVRECGEGSEMWNAMTSAHQMGSCRMGRDESCGGVDFRGQCWEVDGLFVCDSSVLPSALGVNPMITIQSISLCISSHILKFLKSSY